MDEPREEHFIVTRLDYRIKAGLPLAPRDVAMLIAEYRELDKNIYVELMAVQAECLRLDAEIQKRSVELAEHGERIRQFAAREALV